MLWKLNKEINLGYWRIRRGFVQQGFESTGSISIVEKYPKDVKGKIYSGGQEEWVVAEKVLLIL